jgi:hypothetical protein
MKYYVALFEKLKELYKTQSLRDNESILLCPSLQVYEKEDLSLLIPQSLIKKELIGESLLKKQNISYALNSIPNSNHFWDTNTNNTLFDVYKEILEKIHPKGLENATIAIDPNDEAKLQNNKGVPTKEYKAYLKYQALVEKSFEELSAHLEKFADLDTDEKHNLWAQRLTMIKTKIKQATTDFEIKGFKKIIEQVLENINKTSDFDKYLKLIQTSETIFDMVEKTGIQSLESYHDINFVPYDFMQNETGWTNLSLNKDQLDVLYTTAKQNQTNLPEEILTIDYDEKYITSIDLQYSFVHLKRGWFNKDVLTSEFFEWNESKPISDGVTFSSQFVLPAYPNTMILIKNLKINLNPIIPQDQVNQLNQIIQFGPIVMKPQLFVNKANNVGFLKAINNKEILDSNNLQYYKNKVEASNLNLKNVQPNIENLKTVAPIAAMDTAKPLQPMASAMSFKKFNAPIASMRAIRTDDLRPEIIDDQVDEPIFTPILLNPILFQPVEIIPIAQTLATVFINTKDSISKSPVYKSQISIRGINNNYFGDIETDEKGTISTMLPIGNYAVEIKKNGYAIFADEIHIENTNTMTKNFELQPKTVSYETFFLIGMICEKLPKIPK